MTEEEWASTYKLTFNWGAQDRYIELMNCEVEVSNNLETKAYELSEEEKAPVIKNCLGQEGLQLKQMFTEEKKEKCITVKGFFAVLYSKFKPWRNRILIWLQYHGLHRNSNESAQEWMGMLRIKAAECQYNEYKKILTEQFISGLKDIQMISEILKEVVTLEDTEDATNKHVLWVHRVEAQRA